MRSGRHRHAAKPASPDRDPALELGKPVFIEKPMASDLGRRARHVAAGRTERPADHDRFQFPPDLGLATRQGDARRRRDRRAAPCHGALARRKPRASNCACEIGKHRATTAAACWEISSATVCTISSGFAGRSQDCRRASAGCRTKRRPGNDGGDGAAIQVGAAGSLSMSCASFLGAGHRIEFFGEDGTLVLHNPGADYMRGFELSYAKRPAESSSALRSTTRPTRNIPTAASRRCRGWSSFSSTPSRRGTVMQPGFSEGYRVQQLIDAARRSHQTGVWVRSPPLEDARGATGRHPRHRRHRLHRLGAGQGAAARRHAACACSTTIRAGTRAISPTSKTTSTSSAVISATPAPSSARPKAWTRCITSPSSTARNFSIPSPTWCSTSACAA